MTNDRLILGVSKVIDYTEVNKNFGWFVSINKYHKLRVYLN